MTTPNKENIRKWVDALRSGEYQQIQGWLGKPGKGFCCLGVACEVAIKDGLDLSKDTYVYEDVNDEVFQYGPAETYLPNAVGVDWLGLDDIELGPDGDSPVHYNDALGYSFSQIADLIEEKYLR